MKSSIKVLVLTTLAGCVALLATGCADGQVAAVADPPTVTIKVTATQAAPPPVTVTKAAPTVTAPPVTVTATVTSKQDLTSEPYPTSDSTTPPLTDTPTPSAGTKGMVATITTNNGAEEDGRTAFTCADVLSVIRPDIGCLPLYQEYWDKIVTTHPTGLSDFNGSPDIGWFRGSEAGVDARLYVGVYACYAYTDAISRYGKDQGYRDGLDVFKAEVATRFPAADEGDATMAYATATQLLCSS